MGVLAHQAHRLLHSCPAAGAGSQAQGAPPYLPCGHPTTGARHRHCPRPQGPGQGNPGHLPQILLCLANALRTLLACCGCERRVAFPGLYCSTPTGEALWRWQLAVPRHKPSWGESLWPKSSFGPAGNGATACGVEDSSEMPPRHELRHELRGAAAAPVTAPGTSQGRSWSFNTPLYSAC